MKISDMKSLGAIIKRRREQLGYTQAYISDYTGLSVSFISEVENGKDTAQIGKILKLIHILGLDLETKERSYDN